MELHTQAAQHMRHAVNVTAAWAHIATAIRDALSARRASASNPPGGESGSHENYRVTRHAASFKTRANSSDQTLRTNSA
jgi:hypothetical protein